MVKAPAPGLVKTRLSPPLTGDQAAMLSSSFIRDTAENIATVRARVGCQGIGVYTPIGSHQAFDALLPPCFCLLPQRGNGFGERLCYAARDLLKLGYESVCLIDSDSPTLPTFLLEAAADALARSGDRVVLGAADDGGYYLIGVKQDHPELFENIDWSTERVLDQTIRQAGSIRLPVEVLLEWYDVDDAVSLRKLYRELFFSESKVVRQPDVVPFTASNTRACLAVLAGSEPLRSCLDG
jgi:rSAM/selenodomain-associated transferase 1